MKGTSSLCGEGESKLDTTGVVAPEAKASSSILRTNMKPSGDTRKRKRTPPKKGTSPSESRTPTSNVRNVNSVRDLKYIYVFAPCEGFEAARGPNR